MKPSITIVTGLSGSGKTVALRALEDLGFFCVDNIPPELIDSIATTIAGKDGRRCVAIGIDIREKEFLPSMDSVLKRLREKYNVEIVFLDAEPGVLIRRFKETRRPHPLAKEGPPGGPGGPGGPGVGPGGPPELDQAIQSEKEFLAPLRDSADRIVDTSSFNPHQLRRHISSLYGRCKGTAQTALTLISFGYKFGTPQDADLIFDVRFLPNPHFVPELRDLTGLDEPVRKFVAENPEAVEFMERLGSLLDFLIPRYVSEGKAYITIGIGCTGGRHRSPAIADSVARRLESHPVDIQVVHRDI